MTTQRPSFAKTFLDTLSERVGARGAAALFPGWVLACLVVGAGIAYLVPADFWASPRWDISTAVFAAILTFNGLVLALSWNAFSRIHATLLEPDLMSFLIRHRLLNGYLFYIDFTHYAQMVAVGASAAGLLSVLIDLPVLYDRIILAAVIGTSIYATKQAAGAAVVMQDLVYQKAIFDNQGRQSNGKATIRPVD